VELRARERAVVCRGVHVEEGLKAEITEGYAEVVLEMGWLVVAMAAAVREGCKPSQCRL
jgi:hypothetical protein